MRPTSVRMTLDLDDLRIIEDALTYYRICTEQDGPDEHPVEDVRRVERRIGRYLSSAERAS